jgi:integrase
MATGYVRDLWLSTTIDKATGEKVTRRTSRWGSGLRYTAVWEVDGRPVSKSFARKIDASNHLALTVSQQLHGGYVDPRLGRMTVRQFAEQWQQQRLHVRPQTARRHRSTLEQHVYPALGSIPLGQVRRTTVQDFVAGLSAKGLSPSTVRMVYKTVVVALFNAAVRDQLIATSPCRNINLPEAARSEVAALTVEQVLALAEALEKQSPWCAVLAELGAGSGLRPGEMLGLEVDAVDFLRTRSVRVRQQLLSPARGEPYLGAPKTPSSVRTVPLADVTLERLARHLQEFPPRPVQVLDRTGAKPRRREVRLLVTDAQGRPLRANRLSDAWTEAVATVRASGVALPEKVTPHVLRHTYVWLLIQQGRHPKEIQERLGHKSITETMNTYGGLMEQADESTRDAIGAAFRRESPGLRSVRS